MSSSFIYSFDNKRYHTLNYYYRTKFGEKLFKAVINCGFTCPNIDGARGIGGCVFCDGGSGYFTQSGLTVTEQLEAEYERISLKHKNAPIIAYFQANTNTYAPADRLRSLYYEAVNFPAVAGISIGTRADCLPEDVLDLLSELNERTFLTVELGLQTVHANTLGLINRGYSHEEFLAGYEQLKSRKIRTCFHIINGLPHETDEMMIETARQAALLQPDGVKLQMLHVIRGTRLEEIYQNGELPMLSREQYIDIIVRQIEFFPPETVIERLTGDGDKRNLIAPEWTKDKLSVLGGIDKLLAEKDTWQGRNQAKLSAE